jgi:hypothetical protein
MIGSFGSSGKVATVLIDPEDMAYRTLEGRVRGNPKYHALTEALAELHDRKVQDYASTGDPYSNFKSAADVVAGFSNPLDQVFAALIGVKLARLRELTQPGRTPNNESVQDTRRDLANYALIWASYYE